MTQSLSPLDMAQVIKEFVPPPSEILHGAKASISTASVQLTATSTPLQVGVTIKALPGNSGIVYVGSSSSVSTSNGYPLAAGDEKFIACDDLNLIWFYGSVASQEIRYIGN